jgi:cystathionine beta-lyase
MRPNIFGLVGTIAAYKYGEEWLLEVMNYVQKNYHYLEEYISKNLPRVKVNPPEGTYLVWLDFSGFGFENDEQLIEFMNKKAGVGLNPGCWFGKTGSMHMRLNLACPRKRLENGLKRIKKAAAEEL